MRIFGWYIDVTVETVLRPFYVGDVFLGNTFFRRNLDKALCAECIEFIIDLKGFFVKKPIFV